MLSQARNPLLTNIHYLCENPDEQFFTGKDISSAVPNTREQKDGMAASHQREQPSLSKIIEKRLLYDFVQLFYHIS